MYLYHVTNKENFHKILQTGLQPSIGLNSSHAGEDKPMIYLADAHNAPLWQTILGYQYALRIDMAGLPKPEKYEYDDMAEYMYSEPIPPERIAPVRLADRPRAQGQLCVGYIHTLSLFSLQTAIFLDRYADNDKMRQDLINWASTLNEVLPRLHWSQMDPEYCRKKLIEEGEDGEYTLCDTWMYSKECLWEQIRKLNTPTTDALYEWIKDHLSPYLNVNTGGWCK